MNCCRCNPALSLVLLWAVAAAGGPPSGRALSPSHEEVAKTQADFLALKRPLSYKHVLDKPASNPAVTSLDAESHIELAGDAKTLADKTSAQGLIYALWPFLTNQTYDAEAFILLQGKLAPKMASDLMLTYRDAKNQGTWPSYRAHLVERCQRLCRSALNEPEWWYPHPVLFDRAQVLSESKTNATLRAAHIRAMVKALADPAIRRGNPLEVRSVLMILDALKAHEAVQTFVDYMFYDWRTASDYRLGEGDLIPPPRYDPYKPNNLSQVQLPAFMYLPRLGDIGVPLALRRFSDATAEERSTEVGGGATPIIAVKYFIWLRYTEQQALNAISDYQSGAELSQSPPASSQCNWLLAGGGARSLIV